MAAVTVTFVLTTILPAGLRLAAPVLCSTADRTFVVRQPHVEDTSETVRNYTLVCEEGGDVRVPNLVATELVLVGESAAALVVFWVVARIARRGRSAGERVDAGSEPPTKALGVFGGPSEAALFASLFAVISAPMYVMTLVSLHGWLAFDMPYRVERCRASRGGGTATCASGEPVFMLMSAIFGVLALAGLTVAVVAATRAYRRRVLARELSRNGHRYEGAVTEVAAQGRGRNQARSRLYKVSVRAPSWDGSGERIVAETGLKPLVRVGDRVTVAYDPTEPARVALIGPVE